MFEKIEFLMQNLDEENREVIIFGDFNCDLLHVKGHLTRKFLYVINIFKLKRLIKQATRTTENTESLIDVSWIEYARKDNKFWCFTCGD